MAEQPFRSTLNVTFEVFLRQLVVDFTAGAQNIPNAMISRADLLASLLESEQQETSSCPQSPNDDHFDATPVQRGDSGCTRSGDTDTHRRDDSSESDPSASRGRIIDVLASLVMKGITEIVKLTPQEQAPGRIVKQIADTPVVKVIKETVEVTPLGSQQRLHKHI